MLVGAETFLLISVEVAWETVERTSLVQYFFPVS